MKAWGTILVSLACVVCVAVTEAKPPLISGVFVGPELNHEHFGNWTFNFKSAFGTRDVLVLAPHDPEAHFNATYHTADGESKLENLIDFLIVDPAPLKGRKALGIFSLVSSPTEGHDLKLAVGCIGCTHRPHDYKPTHMNRVWKLSLKQ